MSFSDLTSIFELNTLDWILAFLSAFVLGLSKSGVKGIGVIVVTLMAIVFGGKASTGILMPLLIMGDIFAVSYYNQHAQWKYLKKLLPWILIGVLLGVWVGRDLPEALFKQGMAIIILFTVFMMLWMETRGIKQIPEGRWFAGVMGLGAGFTTMIGNLAGAFSNIYFLAMQLPKNNFIGTLAWLFFIVNLFKVPFHIWVWKTITWESFFLNLHLIPALGAGLFAGVQLVKIIKETHYRRLILILTAIGAIVIMLR